MKTRAQMELDFYDFYYESGQTSFDIRQNTKDILAMSDRQLSIIHAAFFN